jgi:hypothetical protein
VRLYDESVSGPLGSRYTVLDGKRVRLTIGSPEIDSPEDYLSIWCESKGLATTLRTHFLTAWRKAKPVKL